MANNGEILSMIILSNLKFKILFELADSSSYSSSSYQCILLYFNKVCQI